MLLSVRAPNGLALGSGRRPAGYSSATRTRPGAPLRALGPDHIHISENVILLTSVGASLGLPWLAFANRRRVQELPATQLVRLAAESAQSTTAATLAATGTVLLDVRTLEQRFRQGLPNSAAGITVLHAPWLRQTGPGTCRRSPLFADDVMFAAQGAREVVIMDMEGEVSAQAAAVALEALGSGEVKVSRLAGGFEAWRAAGLPVAQAAAADVEPDDPDDLLCELEDEPTKEPIFRPKLMDILAEGYSVADLRQDVLSGAVVGIIALSLSMALGIASESTPAVGLTTAVVSGFLISALGGSRVCVGGPTAAFIPVLLSIAHEYGPDNLVLCTGLAGAMLVGMGALGLGTAIKFIPKPVVTGFTAGIATYIFSTQIKDFLGLGTPGALPEGTIVPSEFLEKIYFFANQLDRVHVPSLTLAAVCFGTTLAWPKTWAKVAPPQIVAVLLGTVALIAADTAVGGAATVAGAGPFGIETIGSHYGVDAIPAGLPAPHMPAALTSLDALAPLVQPSLSIALLAAIESLLCARVSDTMIGDRHNPNTELIAQGVANVASAAFGGLPATGALARTAANVRAGGRSPVAGCVHAATILGVMMTAAPLAAYVPLPALSAVLVVVAINMGEWRHFRQLSSWPEKDAQLYLLAFFLTVLQDVTVAVELGMLAALLLFVRDVTGTLRVNEHEEGDLLNVHTGLPILAGAGGGRGSRYAPGGRRSVTPGGRRSVTPGPAASANGSAPTAPAWAPYGTWEEGREESEGEEEDFTPSRAGQLQVPAGVAYLDLSGSLLFGGGVQLERAVAGLLGEEPGDRPRVLVLSMAHLATCDVSGLEVLEQVTHSLRKAGVGLVLVSPTAQPLQMMARAGFLQEVGRPNVCRSLAAALERAEVLADAGWGAPPGGAPPGPAPPALRVPPGANNVISGPPSPGVGWRTRPAARSDEEGLKLRK